MDKHSSKQKRYHLQVVAQFCLLLHLSMISVSQGRLHGAVIEALQGSILKLLRNNGYPRCIFEVLKVYHSQDSFFFSYHM